MKLFVSTYEDMILRGGETYYFRMITWLQNREYKAYLFLPEKCTIDTSVETEIKNKGVSILKYNNLYNDNEIAKVLVEEKYEDLLGIVYTKERYIRLRKLFETVGVKYRLFLYIISPNRVVLKHDWNISKTIMRKISSPICDAGAFAVMDKDYAFMCSEYIGLPKNSFTVVPVGVEIDSTYDVKNTSDKRVGKFTILTVGRFDFPFKGYVVGLIRDFAELCRKYNNIELVIVGYGKGQAMVDEAVTTVDKKYRDKIILKGKIDYHNLLGMYKSASVFVGMGTTLLEAAKVGTISIVASGGQYGNYSSGYFDEADTLSFLITGRYSKYTDVKKHMKYHFKDLIEDVYQMNEETFIEKGRRTYDAYEKTYSMNYVMPYFMERSNGRPSVQTNLQKVISNFYDWRQNIIIELKFIKRKWLKKE